MFFNNTSLPYTNRYDHTHTYAWELAYLGLWTRWEILAAPECLDRQKAGLETKRGFAHPDLLQAWPRTSLHYRGFSTLLTQEHLETGSACWESGRADQGRCIHPESFLKVARLYNTVISTIITEMSAWHLEDDGYRIVLATLGIGWDCAIPVSIRDTLAGDTP